MQPSAQRDIPTQDLRLRSRLLWCRAFICMALGAIAIVFFIVELLDKQSIWMTFIRPLVASGLLSLAVVENALRAYSFPTLSEAKNDAETADKKNKEKTNWFIRIDRGISHWEPHLLHLGLTGGCAIIALYLVSANLSTATILTPPEGGLIPAGSVLLASCFILLVCERTLSFRKMRSWPHQSAIIGLMRALLSIFLLISSAIGLSTLSLTIAFWIVRLASLIVLLIALEFILRTLLAACVLPNSDKNQPFLTQSLIAEQYRWPLHPLLMLRKKIMQHFGVDVGKIQAFRLMGKIFPPVLCGVALVGWLVSGLHEISPSQRGVYERFGRPVAVLPSGLHVGLPWPFGRVISVDFGAVHELQLSEKRPEENANQKIPDTIEGPAPQESWRLWDNTHTTDQEQVIASAVNDKQSFQIVNMDIRLIWRVGLQDQDAMNSLYQTNDLPTTIQRIARQVMTQYFAHQQLDALLNEQRASMSAAMNAAIQKRLDNINTGVELLYTRVESIHPPAGAANAYHGVQAAQIAANTRIAKEKGYAASQGEAARQKAATTINGAQATAGERMAQANIALTRYSAEYHAWRLNPEAYINEQRYQTYSKALTRTPLLILDSQIAQGNESMLDLRQFSQPSR
ncbi:protease modulator HflK [Pantoea sp. B65]|uniref:protease modulator HflK n=1 Tax=Pantoea sp. B65 TaxID=2813359 RepID=UPI0039B6B2C4